VCVCDTGTVVENWARLCVVLILGQFGENGAQLCVVVILGQLGKMGHSSVFW